MAGIYIHIPFCRQKCHYCNFFSVVSGKFREDYIDVLSGEIRSKKDYLGKEEVKTVYFGGGTPSLLTSVEINSIDATLRENFNISPEAEITLEANPDDLSKEWLASLGSTSINRLSIGVQSFFDEDLHYLNRVHNAKQALTAVEKARDAGYKNLTIDLIYGIPGLKMEKWKKNLEIFFSLEIPHLSAYALTVEPRTALHHLIEKKKLAGPDDKKTAAHFRMLQKLTQDQGFVHYEISNFSLPGYYSKHNSLYWLGGHYLGLGPSAHSYNGHSRQWNVSNLSLYMKRDYTPGRLFETESLNPAQKYNEYVMTSLRTMWGADLEHIANIFGESRKAYFLREADKFLRQNLLRREGSVFYITEEGKLFADGIASTLFADEKD